MEEEKEKEEGTSDYFFKFFYCSKLWSQTVSVYISAVGQVLILSILRGGRE